MSTVFTRTSSGLTNLHLFVESDVVVFLEGGYSYSIEEVDNGRFTSCSDDIKFWQGLFSYYIPNKVFEFRSIGSKETVKNIANRLIAGTIENVIVAMDRDYDNLTNSLMVHNNILYSFGYSWENDCWTQPALEESVITLSGLCQTKTEGMLLSSSELFASFQKHIRHAIKADSLLLQNGSSFFDRESYKRYIRIERNGEPKINTQQIKSSFQTAKENRDDLIYRSGDLAKNPASDCFGHLYAYYAYKILLFLLKPMKVPSLPYSIAVTTIVARFISLLSSNKLPELRDHYEFYFGRVSI